MPQLKICHIFHISRYGVFLIAQHLAYRISWHHHVIISVIESIPSSFITMVWILNTLRPGQNDHHFPDDISKCIFMHENAWFSIKISSKFVPEGSSNNIPAVVQIMAWHQTPCCCLNQWCSVYRRIHMYASLGLNRLTVIYFWSLIVRTHRILFIVFPWTNFMSCSV